MCAFIKIIGPDDSPPHSQVLILSLEPGSVVVEMCLLPALRVQSNAATSDTRAPKMLAYELAAQVSDPSSKLHQALTTRHAVKAALKGPLGRTQQEAHVKITTMCTPRGSLSAYILPSTSPPSASPAHQLAEIPERWQVLPRPGISSGSSPPGSSYPDAYTHHYPQSHPYNNAIAATYGTLASSAGSDYGSRSPLSALTGAWEYDPIMDGLLPQQAPRYQGPLVPPDSPRSPAHTGGGDGAHAGTPYSNIRPFRDPVYSSCSTFNIHARAASPSLRGERSNVDSSPKLQSLTSSFGNRSEASSVFSRPPRSEYGGVAMRPSLSSALGERVGHALPVRRRSMSPASKSEPNMPPRLSEESLKEVGALSETGTALLRKGRHAQVRRYIFVIYSLWAGSGACYHL